jgi:hypothetical protein
MEVAVPVPAPARYPVSTPSPILSREPHFNHLRSVMSVLGCITKILMLNIISSTGRPFDVSVSVQDLQMNGNLLKRFYISTEIRALDY